MSFISFIKPGIWPFIVTLFFIIAYIPLMAYTYGTEQQLGAWLVAIVWIGFTGIPPILLHLDYFLNDKTKQLCINNSERFLLLLVDNVTQRIGYEEIERIEKYSSTKPDSFSKMHWFTYFYYRIVITGKEPIFITSMVVGKLEKKVEGITFEYIFVPFPIIKRERR